MPSSPVSPLFVRHDLPLLASTEIRRRRLANGLEAWLWHEPGNPVAVHLSHFRVGSRDETPGRTGLAHFLEHMMFKGSARYPAGAFDTVLTAVGGSNNAWTSNDVTVYIDEFPCAAWETVLDLESDRMVDLALEPESLEREREVVLSERRWSVDDDPLAFFFEQAQLVAAAGGAYAHPVIGWREDIAAWTAADVLDFYRRHYRPESGFLVTAGGIDPERWGAGLEKFYAPLAARGDPQPHPPAPPPPAAGEREYRLDRPGESSAVALALPLPAASDASAEALLEILTTLLAGGESARLHDRLVAAEGLATSVGIFPVGRLGPGQLWIYALASSPRKLARLERRLLEECERFATAGPEDEEFARALRLAEVRHHRRLATTAGRARVLGHSVLLTGDERLVRDRERFLAALSPRTLTEAFAAWLAAPGRTRARLVPAGNA
jgi:zinc protease